MSRKVAVSLLVLVAGAAALRFTLLAPERFPVRAVRVEPGSVESTLANTKAGTVRARRRARMAPETGGRVVEVSYREGEHVEKGAVLLRLNDATQRAQLDLARQTLTAAEALTREACIGRDRARRELERNRKLSEREILSEDLLDGFESAYQAAVAACSARGAEAGRARAEVGVAEAELEKMALRAPFAGVVAELDVEVGEWITPSPPLLVAPAVVDLIDPTSLYVSAPLDEVDAARVEPGQRARVSVDSHPGREWPGRVARVAPYVLDIEAQNRTVEIEVEIDPDPRLAELLPGTSADVEVIVETRDAVLRVPASALLEGDRVLVARDGRLAALELEIGLRNWDWAEVQGGLEPGELVVVSLDRAEIRDGARVEVEETSYQP